MKEKTEFTFPRCTAADLMFHYNNFSNFRLTERGLCSCKKKRGAPLSCGNCLDKRQPLFGACLLKCLVGLVLLYFPTSRGLPESLRRHKQSSCVIMKIDLTFRCMLALLHQSHCSEEQPASNPNRPHKYPFKWRSLSILNLNDRPGRTVDCRY